MLFSASTPSLHLSRWLNVGIIAACFGIFVSLTDFILTPSHKKRLENLIDSITLRLDYTKTLDWLQRWLKASRRAKVMAVFFWTIAVVLALAILILVELGLWEDNPWWVLIGAGVLTLVIWGWQWGWVARAYEKVGIPITESLAQAKSYGALIVEYLTVIFVGALVLAFCIVALIGLIYLVPNGWGYIRGLILLAGNFVFGMVLCWIGIIIDGIVTMIGALIVYVMRTFVDAARFIMWRISSYPKGPLTATLTLIGAILAILKMVLT